MTAPAPTPKVPAPAEPTTPAEDPAYRSRLALHHTSEDVAAFAGAHGFAVVRRPTSATAPKKIGDAQGKQYGFYRVVFVLKGKTPDVWQVLDADEGRRVATSLVEHGNLAGIVPNGGKPYRV